MNLERRDTVQSIAEDKAGNRLLKVQIQLFRGTYIHEVREKRREVGDSEEEKVSRSNGIWSAESTATQCTRKVLEAE